MSEQALRVEVVEECRFLRGWLIPCCISGDMPFVITSGIAREFCRSEEHRMCRIKTGSSKDRVGKRKIG